MTILSTRYLVDCLAHPVRRTLFVEGGDAFLGLGGFARFHVMTQGDVDIFRGPTLTRVLPSGVWNL